MNVNIHSRVWSTCTIGLLYLLYFIFIIFYIYYILYLLYLYLLYSIFIIFISIIRSECSCDGAHISRRLGRGHGEERSVRIRCRQIQVGRLQLGLGILAFGCISDSCSRSGMYVASGKERLRELIQQRIHNLRRGGDVVSVHVMITGARIN